MSDRFPGAGFFRELAARAACDPELAKLGVFDATFGLRVLPDGGGAGPLVVLTFDGFEVRDVRRIDGDAPPDVDFVLEAPQSVWQDLLQDPKTRTINTLTHHGTPMRVIATDPLGHDKLFRFQESVQRVFEIAAEIR